MKISEATIEAYAKAWVELSEDDDYPRAIVIYDDGTVDSGLYDPSHWCGGWHLDKVIGVIRFDAYPEIPGRDSFFRLGVLVEMPVALYKDEMHETIEKAVDEYGVLKRTWDEMFPGIKAEVMALIKRANRRY